MKTYAPKCGFTPWAVPHTPLKTKWDWPKIAVWSGLIAFSVGVWVVIILGARRLV